MRLRSCVCHRLGVFLSVTARQCSDLICRPGQSVLARSFPKAQKGVWGAGQADGHWPSVRVLAWA